MSLQYLEHKHIIITAENMKNPPKLAVDVEKWLKELVDLVNMKVLMGPYAVRCETLGNEGVTGIVCIETSHASIHVWDTDCTPFAKMDLYSCKYFDEQVVINHFKQFSPSKIYATIINRNEMEAKVEKSLIYNF